MSVTIDGILCLISYVHLLEPYGVAEIVVMLQSAFKDISAGLMVVKGVEGDFGFK